MHVTRAPLGGIFRHISDLATAQRDAGHSVGLICDSMSGGAFEEERLAALAPLMSMGIVRVPMPRAIRPSDVSAAFSVARHLGRARPEIVHCHGAKGGVHGRLAAALERRRGRTLAAFYAPHGGSLHYAAASVSGRIYFTVERALERLTDGIIHVSAFEAATYRDKVGVPRCAAHVIRNGLREEEFEPVTAVPDAADFLFIGELRDLKGVDVFIEALAILKAEGRTLRALIVGPETSAEGRRYRAMADAAGLERHLSFRSPMPARRAFALARTIVLPSRAESMPYLVLEAVGAGMPLIATNVGGIPEIFEGTTRRLLPPGDPLALADALRAAQTSPLQMAAEAMLVRERMREKFSLGAMAARTEAVYRGALDHRYRRIRASVAAPADTHR